MDATNPKTQPELTEYALDLVHCKAQMLVGKAGYRRRDVNDIKQDLIQDLLESLPAFDPAKATYETFVSRIVKRKISNMLRDRHRQVRDYRREECSLDDEVDIGEEETEPMFTTINEDDHDLRIGKYSRGRQAREDLQLDTAAVMAKLPPDLRPIAEMLMTMTPAEAARELNIPKSAFHEKYITRLQEIFLQKGMAEHLVV
jgi:RNA polymerase sigma factor (sigma-70 family)